VVPNYPAATNPAMKSRCHADRQLRRFVDRNRSAVPVAVKVALFLTTALALVGNVSFGNVYLAPQFGSAVVAGDKLIFAEPGWEPHRLICISKGDGKKLWEISDQKCDLRPWCFRRNQVIVTLDGEVQSCDPVTGELTPRYRTSYEHDVSLIMGTDGLVFIHGETTNVDFLTCLDCEAWQSRWEATRVTMTWAVGQEALLCEQATRNAREDGSYTLGTKRWVALSKRDGKVLWSCRPFATATTVSNYFLVNDEDMISCLNERDGAILKQFRFNREPYSFSNTTLLANGSQLLVQVSELYSAHIWRVFFALTVPELQWHGLTQEEWSQASEAQSASRDDDYVYSSLTDGKHTSMNRIGIKSGNREKLYEEPVTRDQGIRRSRR